jgi:erythronate-4-phosphate dehydrogenase
MKIVADPNITLVREAFSDFGELILIPGREWTAALVQAADILLVRSVTHVNAALLHNSRVRFVGSATSGIDHIDQDYLKQQDITFACAPGSNANSVAEYVLSALVVLSEQRVCDLADLCVAIIGYGHVGKRIAQLLETLGMRWIANDPPLQQQGGDSALIDLGEALQIADVVSLHVPLTRDTPFPTHRLLDAAKLKSMKLDSILINTARGGVVHEEALLDVLQTRPEMTAVIDCWEHEPNINQELLSRVALGTPHIAGYSYDGKVAATLALYRSVCRFFGKTPDWQPAVSMPMPCPLDSASTDQVAIRQAVMAAYDIRRDSAALKTLQDLPRANRAAAFDRLRADYPERREFRQLKLTLPANSTGLATKLRGLGFQLNETESTVARANVGVSHE